jgi:hypothetical protein
VSYERLAQQLEDAARRLRSRPEALSGVPLARAGEKLQASLTAFVRALEGALRGTDPDVVELRTLLETPEARASLDAAGIKAVTKRAFGKAVTIKKTDTPEDLRRRVVETAVKQGKAGDALQAVRFWISERGRPSTDHTDREAVLAALWRLGGLAPDALEIEKIRLLENRPLLFAMAAHAYIKTTAKSAPRTVLTKVLKFAQRVEENTS